MNYLSLLIDAVFRPTLDIAQSVIFVAILLVALFERFGLRHSRAEMLSNMLAGRKVALALVFAVIATRLLIAPYWVWQDEHEARLQAETKIANLTSRDAIKRQLLAFYEEGEKLTNDGPASREPEQYKNFQTKYVKWRDQVSQWIDKNMARGASAKFLDYRSWFSSTVYQGYEGANQQEVWDRNYISWLCRNLDEMIKSDTWDKH